MVEASGGQAQNWLSRVSGLKQWSKGGERVPNKPLLLLYALGKLHNDGNSRVLYETDEDRLKQLLKDFGPPRLRSPHRPEFAFSRMAGDGIWQLKTSTRTVPKVDSRRALVTAEAVGSLLEEDERLLQAHPELLAQTVQQLLQANWPESLHADICERMGLSKAGLFSVDDSSIADTASHNSGSKQKRDPDFRNKVLRAYEYQCAMCGWDARLMQQTVGLEAAHIRWWAHEGPDELNNGISLCVLHHRLFDRGVIGLSPDLKVMVSQDFNGRGDSAKLVIELANQQIIPPQNVKQQPDEQHIHWHEQQVFQSPAR